MAIPLAPTFCPLAYDRLSPETKTHIVQLSLLGFSTAADFEIRVAGLVGAGPSQEALPTEPALAPIDPTMIQCFYGADEDDTACRSLQGKAEVIRTAGGHHFDGNYGVLAQRILNAPAISHPYALQVASSPSRHLLRHLNGKSCIGV